MLLYTTEISLTKVLVNKKKSIRKDIYCIIPFREGYKEAKLIWKEEGE